MKINTKDKLNTKDIKCIADACECSIATVHRALKGQQDTILLRRVRAAIDFRRTQLKQKQAFLIGQDVELEEYIKKEGA